MVERASASEGETEAIAREFAAGLRAGDVLLIEGALGAGKTAFVRGLAAGLGAPPDAVTSPTFTLVHEYHGRLTLFHADLYRLSPGEVPGLGLDDVAAEGVLAVEWPDRWTSAPPDSRRMRIDKTGETDRLITLPELPARSG